MKNTGAYTYIPVHILTCNSYRHMYFFIHIHSSHSSLTSYAMMPIPDSYSTHCTYDLGLCVCKGYYVAYSGPLRILILFDF